MNIIKYPDNSSYAVVHPVKEFVFRINSYEDLWYLNQTVDALNNLGIIPTVIIPNLIDAQADRRFNHNESSGLKLVCKFLNKMKADFKIFHPHNPEVVEALIDNVEIIDNTTFIKKALLSLDNGVGIDYSFTNSTILMSSDAGGFKPLIKLCDKINWKGETSSASKSRQYIEDKSKLTQILDKNDYEGKDIFIIDDICVNGGTFIGLAKMLRERNCGKLYLAVSHLTVQHPNPELFELFDIVFTTNSKNLDYQIPKNNNTMNTKFPKNLEIINLF